MYTHRRSQGLDLRNTGLAGVQGQPRGPALCPLGFDHLACGAGLSCHLAKDGTQCPLIRGGQSSPQGWLLDSSSGTSHEAQTKTSVKPGARLHGRNPHGQRSLPQRPANEVQQRRGSREDTVTLLWVKSSRQNCVITGSGRCLGEGAGYGRGHEQLPVGQPVMASAASSISEGLGPPSVFIAKMSQ